MKIVKMGISEDVDSGESGCYIVVQHLDVAREIPVDFDTYSRLKEVLDGASPASEHECERGGDPGRTPLEVALRPVGDADAEEDDGVPQF